MPMTARTPTISTRVKAWSLLEDLRMTFLVALE